MPKFLDEKIVLDAIANLQATNSYNVAQLALYLDVSRSKLYRKYSNILPDDTNEQTKVSIISAIKKLRLITNKKKISKGSVAIEANVSRQTIYRYCDKYNDIAEYINGTKDFEDTVESTTDSDILIAQFQRTIDKLKKENVAALEEQKKSTYTALMLRDLKNFSSQELDSSINKLQIQNDELKGRNKQQLNELSILKSELNDLKHSLKGGVNTTVKAHFKANYKSLSTELDEKVFLKLFLKSEIASLEKAIEFCVINEPEAILFFQPFFSCKYEDIPIQLSYKSIVIIESNLNQGKFYNKLLDELPNTPIHSIFIEKLTMQSSRYFCRQTYGTGFFKDTFLSKFFDKISIPVLEDGFKSVTAITATKGIQLVK